MKHNASTRTQMRIDRQEIRLLLTGDIDKYLPEPRKHMADHRTRKQMMILRKQIWEKGE